MIPLLLSVGFRSRSGRWIRVPVPLLLVWLLLLPLAILLLPFFVIACLATQVRPLRTLSVGWQIASALSQTRIEVEQSRTSIALRFY